MRDDVEDPIEENDTVRLPAPPMLIILNRKDNAERGQGEQRVPEAEVNQPVLGVGLDLEGGLQGCRKNQGGKNDLTASIYQQRVAPLLGRRQN